jgi:hypothetical protein
MRSNAKKHLYFVVEKMSFGSKGLFGSGRPKGLCDPNDPLERQFFSKKTIRKIGPKMLYLNYNLAESDFSCLN